jgi:prevent-host-death family protein
VRGGYYSLVKKATISQTKNHLSALLDQVRHGETILIVDRDRPVARLEPVYAPGPEDSEGRLARLERAGLLRRGRPAPVEMVLKKRPPRPRKGGDVLRALLKERREGR